MKQLERILFAQGGECFFCQKRLAKDEASVEHLVAVANGGRNDEDNCVVCCKQLNSLLGSKSIKGKLLVVLNQRGAFACPADTDSTGHQAATTPATVATPPAPVNRMLHAEPKPKVVAKKIPKFVFTLADPKPKPKPKKAHVPSKKASVAVAAKTPVTLDVRDANFKLVVGNLRQRGSSRPRKLKTLTSTIAAILPKGTAKGETALILRRLQSSGTVTLSDENVTYVL